MSRGTRSVEIIAHRGYSAQAPENTLAALDAAFAAGAQAVEFDVHTAACGTPVLFHDTRLSRTTNGVGPLKRRTFRQLAGLDAGSWFSPDFQGEPVPSFAQALEHCKGRIGRVYAEVKGFRELEDVDRMVEQVRDADMLEEVVFIAMNWTLLDRMRTGEPGLKIGYIVEDAERSDEALERAADDPLAMLDYRASILLEDPARVEQAQAAGVALAVWTVDDPEEAERLHALGIRRFTTNEVERLLSWAA